MKTPDPSSDSPRRTPAPPAEPAPRRSDEREADYFHPRYVALPPRRSRAHGQRNLVWGVVLLCLSAGLLAWALYLAGPESVYMVACSLVTGVVLYVAARSRLLRQRNGGFLAAAFVCLFAIAMVLVKQGWMILVGMRSAPVAMAAAPAAIPAVATPSKAPVVAKVDKPALFAQAFKPATDAEPSETVKVMRDFRVEIDQQPYIIRAGDVYPLAGTAKGEVRVAAGEQTVSLPADAVQIQARKLAKAGVKDATPVAEAAAPENPDTPAKITERSQHEAIRRFPALGVKGSRENETFIEAVQELKFTGGSDFFHDPTWPLRLAEMVADKEGWRRAGDEALLDAAAQAPARSAKVDDAGSDEPLPRADPKPATPPSEESRESTAPAEEPLK